MTVLVLSGTREGRVMSEQLHAAGVPVIASLAGATRTPRAQQVPTRIGGFGGAAGFHEFLASERITAVLDATHPFAARITDRSAAICANLGVPYCLFQRPAWAPADGDMWTLLAKEEDAAQHIAPGSTVFLATGRQTLHRFENLKNCYLICRQIDKADTPFPFPNGEYLIGNPPFEEVEEIKLFEKRKIDWLVVKNAGGHASRSKLDAARKLGIKVGMIQRPQTPDAMTVSSESEALAWAMQFHG